MYSFFDASLLTFKNYVCILIKVSIRTIRKRTKCSKGEIMSESDQKINEIHMGRLIHILSHQMKRRNVGEALDGADELTTMQKHVLKFILLESRHHDIYQKDVEEEFCIRKSTATGILKLMEEHGFITREAVEFDARLKKLVPTAKAKKLLTPIMEHINQTEAMIVEGISKEDVLTCKRVMCLMYRNLVEEEKKKKK